MAPQYMFDVRLPDVIGDFMAHSSVFLVGTMDVCSMNTVDINQPTPLGWLTLSPRKYSYGTKTPHGVTVSERVNDLQVWAKRGLSDISKKDTNFLSMRYQVYSQ